MNTRHGLLLFFLLLGIGAYAQKDTVITLKEGDIIARGIKKGGVFTGTWVYYDKFNRLMKIENYNSEGTRHGYSVEYNAYGQIQKENWYDNGTLSGPQTRYANGIRTSEMYIVDGKKQGPYMVFYANGAIDSAGVYKNDTKVGTWLRYYDNGNMQFSTQYNEAGQREGKERYFSSEGAILAEYTYKNDLPEGKYTEFNKGGGIAVQGQFRAGLREGDWFEYDDSGRRLKTVRYKNDVEVKP
ncbi:MAG: toxin-antitoxin system YwqK family antitoxin [Bacteroidia bacterium]|nr:toxin-antitoxin system YwqK family antitoxin [Bacteroidia bacterium]